MRTLLFLLGFYLVHRVLLVVWPAYAERMRRMDRRLAWMSFILGCTYLPVWCYTCCTIHVNQRSEAVP
jgi:hypothetical protein